MFGFGKIVTRLTVIYSTILLALTALMVFGFFLINKHLAVQKLSAGLKNIAATASLSLDAEIHQAIPSARLAFTPEWQEARHFLKQVQEANQLEIDHLYTFTIPNPDDLSELRFVVMLHENSFIGHSYQVPEENRGTLADVMMGGVADTTDIYTDANGTWISAYAPIKNDAGLVVGILEADYRVDTDNGAYWNAVIMHLMPILLLFAGVLVVGLVLIFYSARSLANPILKLVALTEETARGTWDKPIPAMGWVELKRLGVAFEKMRTTIHSQIDALSSFNQKLEKEVAIRTEDLTRANCQLKVAQENLKQQKEAELAYRDTHDALTGLGNRKYFNERLTLAIAKAQLAGEKLAVVAIDLDRFKHLNDSLGHAVGDRVLLEAGNRILAGVKGSDELARTLGNEFALILPNLKRDFDACHVAERLLKLIAEPFQIGEMTLHQTCSIGIALYPNDGTEVGPLLKNAETAMNRAKEQGGGNFIYYTRNMSAELVARLELENHLRHALERDEFTLHYQPQVDLRTGVITGVEALIRWNSPVLGFTSPAAFIPLAEETGLIVPIGKWVLDTVCARRKAWSEAGVPPFRVAVNLSSRQFEQQNLLDSVKETLQRTGLDPCLLELEITESIAMQDVETTIKTLSDLREMGIYLAIDDFGTGYSSLSYLKQFALDKLKIDKSFVDNITETSGEAAIARSVIALARALCLKVIAEGVETQAQWDFLADQGCDEVQGYFFSRPLPEPELLALLQGAGQAVEAN